MQPSINSWPWLMASNEHMDTMAEMARKKTRAGNERAWKKEELEASKKKRQVEKAQEEANKKARADQRVATRKFDETRSTRNIMVIGDALHKKIKENHLIVGYIGRYITATCHHCTSTT